jgi:Protein kinase domain
MTAGLLATDPTALGPYRLLGRLGGGGMGQVYLAESPSGERAAVKVIRPEFAADPEFRARFTREVANARNVSGMYTALLVDADTDGPVPWLATAYIAGPPLSAAVRDSGPLPLSSLLPLATGLATALAAIHAAGVVHRDLKPSNVLLAQDGPRVIDFGISHAVEASTLTQTGAVVGSPGYMSPEQAQGLRVGPPSDVFSLGAVLAFAATGTPTFGTGSIAALVYRVVSEPPDLDQVPPRLRPLLAACLAKDPGDRPSVDDVLADVGGGLVRPDWLPLTVADTIARYEPAARLAEIAARDSPGLAGPPVTAPPLAPVAASAPDARDTETSQPSGLAAGTAAAAGAGETAPPAGQAGAPPASPPSRHRRPGSPAWSRRRRQAVTVTAVVAAVAVLATWLATGTDTFGNHPGGRALAATPPTSPGRHTTPAPSSPGAGKTPGHRSGASPAATVSHSPSPSVSPTPSASRTPPASANPVASSPSPARSPSTAPATSPAATQTQAGASGPLSGSGVTIYSCADYPVGDASGTPAFYAVTNNTASDVSVWFIASGGYSGGETGPAAANATSPFTLGIGGVYVLKNAAGSCIGAVQVDSASGQLTVSSR